MNAEWGRATRYLAGIGLVLAGAYLIYISFSTLVLVLIAALLAFLLVPLVNFCQHKLKLPRIVAVLLSYLLLAFLLLLSPLIFIPPIRDGYAVLRGVDYRALVAESLEGVKATLASFRQLQIAGFGTPIDLSALVDPALELLSHTDETLAPTLLPSLETLSASLSSALSLTFGVASNVVGQVFSFILSVVIIFWAAIYFSLDAPKFKDWFFNLVPTAHRPELEILALRLARIWRAYFRGQLTLMIIVGMMTWLGNTALGVRGAFTLGFIAGLLEIVPGVGPFLALVPAVLVALLQGSTYLNVSHSVFALIVVGLYILIQQIENNFLVPRIVGEAVELHPLVVMIGVVIGASLGGILGTLLAAPVIASGREIAGYVYVKILGQVPYPSGAEQTEDETPAWLQHSQKVIARLMGQPAEDASEALSPPDKEGGPKPEEQ
jgi:predicted PurR-regulated permease PerM